MIETFLFTYCPCYFQVAAACNHWILVTIFLTNLVLILIFNLYFIFYIYGITRQRMKGQENWIECGVSQIQNVPQPVHCVTWNIFPKDIYLNCPLQITNPTFRIYPNTPILPPPPPSFLRGILVNRKLLIAMRPEQNGTSTKLSKFLYFYLYLLQVSKYVGPLINAMLRIAL